MRAVYVLGKLLDVSGPGLEEAGRYIHGVLYFEGMSLFFSLYHLGDADHFMVVAM